MKKSGSLPDEAREVEVFHRLRKPAPILSSKAKRVILIVSAALMVPVLSLAWAFGTLVSYALGRQAPTVELIEYVSEAGSFILPEDISFAEDARLNTNPFKVERLSRELGELGTVSHINDTECSGHTNWGGPDRSGSFVSCVVLVDYQYVRQNVQVVWVKQKGRWRLDDYQMNQVERSPVPKPASQ